MTENVRVQAIIEWLAEKKAENVKFYDVQKVSSYTDMIIVCEGNADLHVRAIANYLISAAKEYHLKLISKEGLEFSHWVLLDFGDIVVHIFLPQTRLFYRIDELFMNQIAKTQEESTL